MFRLRHVFHDAAMVRWIDRLEQSFDLAPVSFDYGVAFRIIETLIIRVYDYVERW